mmetsp:Transcript_4449/g.17037  ORF Transcript_4449/g.17037 Transcript_4449/m.17037 type:complete len:231 (+) Transcript_4449:975-1667(+)
MRGVLLDYVLRFARLRAQIAGFESFDIIIARLDDSVREHATIELGTCAYGGLRVDELDEYTNRLFFGETLFFDLKDENSNHVAKLFAVLGDVVFERIDDFAREHDVTKQEHWRRLTAQRYFFLFENHRRRVDDFTARRRVFSDLQRRRHPLLRLTQASTFRPTHFFHHFLRRALPFVRLLSATSAVCISTRARVSAHRQPPSPSLSTIHPQHLLAIHRRSLRLHRFSLRF